MPSCSKCGKDGHNARTCGKLKPVGRPARKPERHPPLPPPDPTSPPASEISVLDALRARQAQLRAELEGVEQKRRELTVVESAIDQIEEVRAS